MHGLGKPPGDRAPEHDDVGAQTMQRAANRIGVGWVKNELEDLCLKHLKPDVYEMLRVRVAKRDEDRQQYIQEVRELVEKA